MIEDMETQYYTCTECGYDSLKFGENRCKRCKVLLDWLK